MKKRTISSVLVLASLTLVLVSEGMGEQVEKRENGPKIQVIPERLDFGKIPRLKTSRRFLVRNRGKSPLEIYHLSTSCGCATASIDKKLIQPGQSATLTVTFDPNAHAPPKKETTPRQRRTIYIRSNDPVTPEKVIHITATVV